MNKVLVTSLAAAVIFFGGSTAYLYPKYQELKEVYQDEVQKNAKEDGTEKVVSDATQNTIKKLFTSYYKEMSTLDKSKINKFTASYFDKKYIKTLDVDTFVSNLEANLKDANAKKSTYTGKVVGVTVLENVYYVGVREYVSFDDKKKTETGIGLYSLEKQKDGFKIIELSVDDEISEEFSNTIESNGATMTLEEKEDTKDEK